MTPSNYQIPVWQATSIPSCRPLISSHCMRPHSQKLYKTEADSQLDYQHSRLHKSWCIFKCIFPFEINHIVNAPTDRELKNSFSQYSTSTLQECIKQTYCMYIYIYRCGGETGFGPPSTLLFFDSAFLHLRFAKRTNNTKLYISEFQHESSKISRRRRFAINFYVWVSQTNSA